MLKSLLGVRFLDVLEQGLCVPEGKKPWKGKYTDIGPASVVIVRLLLSTLVTWGGQSSCSHSWSALGFSLCIGVLQLALVTGKEGWLGFPEACFYFLGEQRVHAVWVLTPGSCHYSPGSPSSQQLAVVMVPGDPAGIHCSVWGENVTFNFTVMKWLLMRNKTISYFFHSSDGGNSVKRLKLDTDHEEKNQGTFWFLQSGSCLPLSWTVTDLVLNLIEDLLFCSFIMPGSTDFGWHVTS